MHCAVTAAVQHPAAQQGQRRRTQKGREGKALLQRLGDGAGLGHAAAGEAGQRAENAEEDRQRFAEGVGNPARDVVHRAAAKGLCALVPLPPAHRQQHLGIFGHHAQKGADPHPEDAACAAQGQCSPHADDVAHPHGAAQRGADRRKGADAPVFSVPLLKERADRPFEHGGQAGQGQKAGPGGEVKPAQQGEGDGPPAPEQLGEQFYSLPEHAHPSFLLQAMRPGDGICRGWTFWRIAV